MGYFIKHTYTKKSFEEEADRITIHTINNCHTLDECHTLFKPVHESSEELRRNVGSHKSIFGGLDFSGRDRKMGKKDQKDFDFLDTEEKRFWTTLKQIKQRAQQIAEINFKTLFQKLINEASLAPPPDTEQLNLGILCRSNTSIFPKATDFIKKGYELLHGKKPEPNDISTYKELLGYEFRKQYEHEYDLFAMCGYGLSDDDTPRKNQPYPDLQYEVDMASAVYNSLCRTAQFSQKSGDNSAAVPLLKPIISQSSSARARHTYIIGKSGSGKTTLLLNMIHQDLKLGNGLGVIAPEQEMITEGILPYIPENRLDDVVYFNPADPNPVSFNPLHLDEGEDIDLKVDENMTIFKRIMGGETGPRMDEILRQSFYALIELPKTTLLDIPKLLDRENPHYRQQVIAQLTDPETIHFWRDTYPQFDKNAHLPILNRLSRFTRSKKIRNTTCQTEKSLNFRQLMDTGKIALFNLSDGILGEQNSQLLGQLIVSKFQQATMSRANIPEQQRRQFYLYLDEFQTFTSTASASYEKILSRARKYRLALILAHQQTHQIPIELLREIFGNVSTMVAFMVSYDDAKKLAREFIINQDGKLAPTPTEQFLDLKVGETYCKMAGQSFKMKAQRSAAKPNQDMVEKIIERSRTLYATAASAANIEQQPQPKPQPQPPPPPPPTDTGFDDTDPNKFFWHDADPTNPFSTTPV